MKPIRRKQNYRVTRDPKTGQDRVLEWTQEENILSDVPAKHTGFTHIALEINDREAVEKHLAEENIPITETVKLPDGTVFFFVRDPDGNVIEFHKPTAA